MRAIHRLGGAAVLGTAIVTVLASPAFASPTHSRNDETRPFERRGVDAVFVQTDNTAGNQVVAYRRSMTARLPVAMPTRPAVLAAA